MNKIILFLLMGIISIRAQDVRLGPTSSAEDVMTALKTFIEKYPGPAAIPPDATKAEMELLKTVPHTVLIQAMVTRPVLPPGASQQDSRTALIQGSMLCNATINNATENDLPALLTDKTGQALVIILARKWVNNPLVTAYLLEVLPQYQESPPSDFSTLLVPQVLRMAVDNHDPKVVAALNGLVNKTVADNGTPKAFLGSLAEICARSDNSSSQNHVITLMPVVAPDDVLIEMLGLAVAEPHTTLLAIRPSSQRRTTNCSRCPRPLTSIFCSPISATSKATTGQSKAILS
jgi:hypothetical protein